jgi:hypothetical protein
VVLLGMLLLQLLLHRTMLLLVMADSLQTTIRHPQAGKVDLCGLITTSGWTKEIEASHMCSVSTVRFSDQGCEG